MFVQHLAKWSKQILICKRWNTLCTTVGCMWCETLTTTTNSNSKAIKCLRKKLSGIVVYLSSKSNAGEKRQKKSNACGKNCQAFSCLWVRNQMPAKKGKKNPMPVEKIVRHLSSNSFFLGFFGRVLFKFFFTHNLFFENTIYNNYLLYII